MHTQEINGLTTPSSQSLLHQAVLWENVDLLSDLLRGEAASHINHADEHGRTPLHVAAQSRKPDLTLILLNAGADPNVQNAASLGGETPLHVAARGGRQEIVAALLSAGASVGVRSVRRQRPIDVATSDNCWQLLKVHGDYSSERLSKVRDQLVQLYRSDAVDAIEKLCKDNKFDIPAIVEDCVIVDGATNVPLICHAAAANKSALLKLLLTCGVSAQSAQHPWSALHYAVAEGALEAVALLLEHRPELAAKPTEDSNRDLPVHLALKRSQNDAVKMLLQYKFPTSLLHKYEAGEFEFELPFNLNAFNGEAETPLYIACSTGNFKAVHALLGFHVESFRRKQQLSQRDGGTARQLSRLVASAASPDAVGDAAEQDRRCPIIVDCKCGVDGKTALFAAVSLGRADIVRALLERGADPNTAVGNDKRTDCLGSAMLYGFDECAQLLLDHKASDQFGTAISIAMRNFDAVEREKVPAASNPVSSSQSKSNLLTRVLATHVQRDAEFKINKLAMETLHSHSTVDNLPPSASVSPSSNESHHNSKGVGTRTFTYNSMYPSTPLAIDWQNIPSLTNIRLPWLVHSAMSLNERLQQSTFALYAITRLNISNTPLQELPVFLFELRSLRVLNASHCQLLTLPDSLPFLRKNAGGMTNTSGGNLSRTSAQTGKSARQPLLTSPVLLSVLQELNISHNKLEMLPVDLFRLPCLQILDASENSISFIPLQIWFAPSLNELNLSRNRLVSLPVAAASQPPRITALRREASKLASNSVSRSHTLYSFPSTSVASFPVALDGELKNSPEINTRMEEQQRAAQDADDAQHLFRQHTLHHSCYWIGNIGVVQVLSGSKQPLLGGDVAAAATGISKLGGRSGADFSSAVADRTSSAVDLLNSNAAWASRLQILNVSHNYITELPPQLACLCPILTTLKISYNRLEDAGLTSIYPFSLKHLDLSHNMLINMPSDLLAVAAETLPGKLVKPVLMPNKQNRRGRRLTSNDGDFTSSASVMHIGATAPVGMKRSNSSYSYAAAASSLSESFITSSIAIDTEQQQKPPHAFQRMQSQSGNSGVDENSSSTAVGTRFECGRGASTTRHVSPRVRLSMGNEAAAGFVGCPHRQHWRLENLRSLDISFNRIRQLVFMRDADHAQAAKEENWMLKRATKESSLTSNTNVPGRAARDASTTRGARGVADRNPTGTDLTLFPALTTLDASNNAISSVPADIAEMSSLSALNVAANISISDLPKELGLLSRLWTVNARGCELNEPLRTMLDNAKTYRTSDVLMYLRSVLEDSQPYRRIKLMLIGDENKGKTTLLNSIFAVAAAVSVQQQQSARKSNSRTSRLGRYRSRSSAPGHMLNNAGGGGGRMRSSSRSRAQAGMAPVISVAGAAIPLSNIGIDLNEFTYRPDAEDVLEEDGDVVDSKDAPESENDPNAVTFRTWDFDGQQDQYFAIHQYFLTRRSIYLCVWNMTDGEQGVAGLARWLIAIQSRAPHAPVVIVGTHLDVLQKQLKPSAYDAYVTRFRQRIAEQYIDVVDPDKWGLPRVVAQIELALASNLSNSSRRSMDNQGRNAGGGSAIKQLCQILYETARKERATTGGGGGNLLMLDEKVPKLYLQFEQLIYQLRGEMAESGQHPVLNWEQYEAIVRHELHARFKLSIRDARELLQMTRFMHENGILSHYESSGTLSTLFFLDPQWLCDMLARIVSVKQQSINSHPYIKNGLMKTDDMKHLFKSTKYASVDILSYIVELLNKFELALTLDAGLMLIPSLLPIEKDVFPQSSFDAEKTDDRIAQNLRQQDQTNAVLVPTQRALPTLVPLRPITPQALVAFLKITNERTTVFANMLRKGGRPVTPSPSLFNVKYDDARTVRRFYLTKYFPSGFWARLITRLISDERYQSKVTDVLINSNYTPAARRVWRLYLNPHWVCWQNGIELVVFEDIIVMRLRLLGHQPLSYAAAPAAAKTSPTLPVTVRNSKPPTVYPAKTGIFSSGNRKRSETFSDTSDAGRKMTLKNFDGFDTEVNQRQNRGRFRKTLALPTNSLIRFDSDAHKAFYDGYERKRTLLFANYSVIELTVMNAAIFPCSTTPPPLKALFDDTNISATSTENPEIPSANSSMFSKAEFNVRVATFFLNITAHHIDSLLEDWYPSVGTRFLHTSQGENLLYRVCICPYCFMEPQVEVSSADSTITPSKLRERKPPKSDDNGSNYVGTPDFEVVNFDAITNEAVVAGESRASSSTSSSRNGRDGGGGCIATLSAMQGFLVEECICCMLRAHAFACPLHGELNMSDVAPDVIFADIPAHLLIKPSDIKRGRILGSGAFGFVFKSVVYEKGGSERNEVAVKTLVPCEPPGYGADPRYVAEYRAALGKWEREPLQTSTQAYLSARQELNILTAFTYRYIVALRGICLKPCSLVLELAPLGSLLTQLQALFQKGAHLRAKPLQRVCVQISQALEFLHFHHIIFRDLKSDNVLVWELDNEHVLVKLADYGISRIVAASNTTKGFAGTEAYIAPEIIRFAGEEEYNEKADCYSFAMLLYELITLRQPLSGQEALKEFILDGGRPPLTTLHLHYPSPVYDLMTLAWSQAPSERPSSSQIVSITRTPEFSHLQDAVALSEAKSDTGSAGVFAFSNFGGNFSDGGGDDVDDFWLSPPAGTSAVVNGGIVWLLSRSGVCDMLEVDHEGFRAHKSRADCLPARISLAEKVDENTMWVVSPTTSLLVVDIHSAWTAEKLDTVVLPDFICSSGGSSYQQQQQQQQQHAVKITAMHFIDALKAVALVTSDNRLVLLHTSAHMRAQPDRLVIAHCKVMLCQPPVTAIASHATAGNMTEIWLAGCAGILAIFVVNHAQLSQTTGFGRSSGAGHVRQQQNQPPQQEILREISSLNIHQLDRNNNPAGLKASSATDTNDSLTNSAQLVKFLICSTVAGTTYTYCVFENSTALYQIDAVKKQLINKFDYSKIPPVSESFQEDGEASSPIAHENVFPASSKMEAVDKTISSLCACGPFVYVGIANGTLIVLDQHKKTLRTVIRPHHRSLFAIVPLTFRLPFACAADSGGAGRSSTPNRRTSKARGQSVGRKQSGEIIDVDVDNVVIGVDDVDGSSSSSSCFAERIVGFGHGYRDVMSRFLYESGSGTVSASALTSSLNVASGSASAVLPANRKKQNVVPHVVCGTLWRHEDWNWS